MRLKLWNWSRCLALLLWFMRLTSCRYRYCIKNNKHWTLFDSTHPHIAQSINGFPFCTDPIVICPVTWLMCCTLWFRTTCDVQSLTITIVRAYSSSSMSWCALVDLISTLKRLWERYNEHIFRPRVAALRPVINLYNFSQSVPTSTL